VNLGEAPTALAFGLDAEWAILQSTNCLVKIDPNTMAASAGFTVGDTPTSLAVGSSAVWVANQGDGTVSRIDPATEEVASFKIDGTPTAIAADDEGVWVADFAEGSVTKLDPSTGEVVATVKVAAQLTSIATDGDSVWVGSAEDGKIYRIDTNSNLVVGDVLVTGIPEIMLEGGYLWVMSGASGEVSKLNSVTGDVLAKNEVIPGGTPTSVTYRLAVGDKSVWLLVGGVALYELDKDSLNVTATTALPQGAATLSTGGGDVWVASGDTVEQIPEGAG
jgi:DNA-binding beta-propeller fold protein YncE